MAIEVWRMGRVKVHWLDFKVLGTLLLLYGKASQESQVLAGQGFMGIEGKWKLYLWVCQGLLDLPQEEGWGWGQASQRRSEENPCW